jgi:ABC-2 type transport system ATP-binding protein
LRRIDLEGADAALRAGIAALPGVAAVSEDGGHTRVDARTEEAVRSVLRLVVEAGLTSVRTSPPSLDEVYVSLVGDRGLRV